jgi:hypothetical protein
VVVAAVMAVARVHPRRCVDAIFPESLAVGIREGSFKGGDVVVGDSIFFKVAESLNDKARETPSSRHVLRCSAAKLNLLVSHCHVFFGTVGKIHDLGGHLLRQPE